MTMAICPKCKTNFDNYSKWGKKRFCSRKCSNSRSFSKETNQKKSISAKKFLSKLSETDYDTYIKKTRPYTKIKNHVINTDLVWKYLPVQDVVGEYTKIYLCICKYSKQKFYSKTVKQIHPNLARSKKEYTYSCQFKFSISSYPNWFIDATQLIKKYGWYSTPGSKNKMMNTNGISRDHLYSITDGWINNIPPYIIRHPANCSLIPHKENQSKYKSSKITIEELYKRIEHFQKIYGDP